MIDTFSCFLVLPIITGTCDQNQFYISVTYGSQGNNFQTMVGPSQLTSALAEGYNFQENRTHFSLMVPYTAMDVAFEVCQTSKSPHKSSALDNFPLSCS